MIAKKINEVGKEVVEEEGVKGAKKQVLIGSADGAQNFIMRRFIVEPGGYTFHHTHDFEHEIFILSGKGKAKTNNSEIEIGKDMAIYIPPNELHQLVNNGDKPLIFLCIIPNK
jgi:quercetin dioxygenase-like cupin family protein